MIRRNNIFVLLVVCLVFSMVFVEKAYGATWNLDPHIIEFDTNGGTFVDFQEAYDGNIIIRPEDPTKVGHIFDDWYEDEELTIKYDFDTPVYSGFILYARWVPVTYTVTFEANGGSEVAKQDITYGTTATKPSNPTKLGNTFDDWYEDEELTNKYDFDTTITQNMTLYAKWVPVTYTVTFEANGGSEVAKQDVAYGTNVTRPNNPTKLGYVFDDWYKDEELTIKYDFDAVVTQNMTLYAKWNSDSSALVETIIVTFDGNGGTSSESSITVNKGSEIGTLSTASRDNYIFDGWYTLKEEGTKISSSVIVDSNITYYAHWIYDKNDSTTNAEEIPLVNTGDNLIYGACVGLISAVIYIGYYICYSKRKNYFIKQ